MSCSLWLLVLLVVERKSQERLRALEEQLQVVKSAVNAQQQSSKLTVVGDSLQFASYAALCALADQTLASGSAEKQLQQHHPTISSFESEREMISYIKGVYAIIDWEKIVSVLVLYHEREVRHSLRLKALVMWAFCSLFLFTLSWSSSCRS